MSGYIGTQPVPQATQTRDAFTATSGQTSFATSGYTPSFLDVYLNGIKLAAADYTASNGSDVVLASGAATGDILEVVAYTSFEAAHVTGADDFTVTGSFTSQGIDDNATSTAMTLDSSGNLLVGTTTAFGNTGITIDQSGQFFASRSSNPSVVADRRDSDGDVIHVRKNGSTVGSIGVNNSLTYITTNGGFGVGSGITFDSTGVLPTTRTGGVVDNVFSLGSSSARFKDLYLSGGVYLGGTGSANKLDDVESGTWTATLASITGASLVAANYVKVGRLVTVFITFTCTGAPTANSSRFSLPFTPDGPNIFGHGTWSRGTVQGGALEVQSANPVCYFAESGSSSGTYLGTATYQTS